MTTEPAQNDEVLATGGAAIAAIDVRRVSTDDETAPRQLFGLRVSAIVETALFLALAVAIDILLLDGDRMWDIRPHPFWIIVLLMAVQYGSGEALFAAILSTAALFSGALPAQAIDQEVYSYFLELMSRPIMWLTAAVFLGELRARQLRERQETLDLMADADQRLDRLSAAYNRLDRVKNNLEVRVAGQLDTFVTTYRAAQAIERRDPGEVLLGVAEVIRSVINPEKFSLFLLHNDVLEASMQDGWESGDGYARIFHTSSTIFAEVVGARRIVCAANSADQQLLGAEGVLAGPLISTDTDEVIGMLKIEKLALFDLNVSTIENFRALSSWIGTAYSNAMAQTDHHADGEAYLGRTILPFRFYSAQQSFLISLARRMEFDLTAGLVEAVVNRGRPDIARALLDRLGEGFLAARPILAARLALLRGDEAAARRWAAAAAADPDLRLDQRIGLAGLYQRLGRDGDALALLRALAQSPDAPETVVADLAQLYLDLGRAAEGVAVLDALRAERPSPRINAAWALLTAAAKGDAAVLAWLETAPDAELGDRLLEDLYFIASANDADALALAAAERLYARRPDARRELYLARALIAGGRPGEALARLRGLLPGDAEVAGAYLEALTAALKDGQPVREELVAHLDRRLADPNLTEADRDALVSGLVEAGAYTAALPILESLARTRGGPWFWTFTDIAAKAGRADLLAAFLVDELDRPGLSRKQREERLYLLMERGGVAAALPYLEVFADEYGGQWIFAYAEALDRAGRADAATDYFERVALDPGLDAEARRGIAFRLLEAGRKAAAERIFMTLAEAEPPSGPDLQQLLYLWGPRPPADRVDWLVLRGEAVTDGRDRAGWMRALVDVGAAERALALAGPDGGPAKGPVFEAYLEALAVLRLRAQLAEGLALRIPIEDAPRKLRWLGQLAADNQLPAQALAAYEKLLIALPRNAEVLREAGLAALAEGALERAREHLTRYFELAAGDAEINFVYGDLLAELGWRDLAAFHYARALDSIDGEARPDYALRVLRASALARLGEVDRAIEAFEDLRAERPGDPNLRADFAALLIESQRYGRAGHVLSTE